MHPYRWATIGVSPEHIERATLEDVGAFFRQFYAPDNAIVSICGNIAEDKALELVKKWFGDIPPAHGPVSHIPAEPRQTEERRSIVPDNNVPADAIYKVFHWVDGIATIFMPVISSPTFYPTGNLHVSTST